MTTADFPFPFRADTFRYSTNVEPARAAVATDAGRWGEHVFHADGDYAADLALREQILTADPTRYRVLPHMLAAAWDALLTVLTELAHAEPGLFRLDREGSGWRWQNRLLGIDQFFVFGQDASLPLPPLRYAASQVQDDLVLLDQRDDELWADAGVVTFAADWSLGFDVGMRFLDLHAPVPQVLHREGVLRRAHEVLLRLEPGRDLRRTNWIMTMGRYLDMSTERAPGWTAERDALTASVAGGTDLGQSLFLRTELQHLLRLPLTGTILFTIRTYHLSMAQLASVPAWKRRFQAVVTELPDELVQAKRMTDYHPELLAWLAMH